MPRRGFRFDRQACSKIICHHGWWKEAFQSKSQENRSTVLLSGLRAEHGWQPQPKMSDFAFKFGPNSDLVRIRNRAIVGMKVLKGVFQNMKLLLCTMCCSRLYHFRRTISRNMAVIESDPELKWIILNCRLSNGLHEFMLQTSSVLPSRVIYDTLMVLTATPTSTTPPQ